MKKVILILTLLLFTSFVYSQVIDWDNIDERKMDTVMFNMMNNYVRSEKNGDSLIWSPVIQKEVMPRNYTYIKEHIGIPLNSLYQYHNTEWVNNRGNDLPKDIREKIIEENINPVYLSNESLKGFPGVYGLFEYSEILICIKGTQEGETYQNLAMFCIESWNSSPQHATIMNANYKNKVIVGVITLYDKKNSCMFISFVFVS